MLVPVKTAVESTNDTRLLSEHVLISVTLSCNKPKYAGFDYSTDVDSDDASIGKRYILDADPRILVRKMFETLDVVVKEACRLMLGKLAPLIEMLEQQDDKGKLLRVRQYATGVPVIGFNTTLSTKTTCKRNSGSSTRC